MGMLEADIYRRLTVIETKVTHVEPLVDRIPTMGADLSYIKDELHAIKTTLSEIAKVQVSHSSLISYGRGAFFVLIGLGSAMMWLFAQFKSSLGIK